MCFSKAPRVSAPAPDPEIVDLNKRFLRLAISQAEAPPSELETALNRLAQMAVEEQQKTIKEGPTIPPAFKEAIRGSFGVARGDVTEDINKTFENLSREIRRSAVSRGVGETGSTLLTDPLAFTASEQGKLLERAISRLAAAQATAETTGATDLAALTQQALSTSTGRSLENLGLRFGLTSQGAGRAMDFTSRQADRQLQAAIARATLRAQQPSAFSTIMGGVGALGGAAAGIGLGFGPLGFGAP